MACKAKETSFSPHKNAKPTAAESSIIFIIIIPSFFLFLFLSFPFLSFRPTTTSQHHAIASVSPAIPIIVHLRLRLHVLLPLHPSILRHILRPLRVGDVGLQVIGVFGPLQALGGRRLRVLPEPQVGLPHDLEQARGPVRGEVGRERLRRGVVEGQAGRPVEGRCGRGGWVFVLWASAVEGEGRGRTTWRRDTHKGHKENKQKEGVPCLTLFPILLQRGLRVPVVLLRLQLAVGG